MSPATADSPQLLEVFDLRLLARRDGAQPDEAEELRLLVDALAQRERLAASVVGSPRVARRSLDVRGGQARFSYTLEARLPARAAERLVASGRARQARPRGVTHRWALPASAAGAGRPPPVVVGAGPAGLFAALTLAEAGLRPCIIDRGEAVEGRARKVSQLYARGRLDPDSNVCFGEGGAGTFSDGKLYTRVGDARVDAVLRHLVRLGAPARILVDARPHLGTDRLIGLLRAMRRRLLELGATFRFGTKVVGLQVRRGRAAGVQLADGQVVEACEVVMATGHSADGIWRLLANLGLPLQARPFAVGFRVEHPQALIGALRYGDAAPHLPSADYRLAYNELRGGAAGDAAGGASRDDARGVWSFCMCPGGVVVPTPTADDGLCLNGMSHASRAGHFANSALVVGVTPQELAGWGFEGLFAGHDFARQAERAAFDAGGGAFVAPACRLTDFLAGRPSAPLGRTSYRRGLRPHSLEGLYPPAVTAALRRALREFNRQIRGFVSDEAVLIGVETRTASPIRVPRGDDHQAVGMPGLYPAGEGMGYGGGIVSAAVDGIRVAESMLTQAGARCSCARLPA